MTLTLILIVIILILGFLGYIFFREVLTLNKKLREKDDLLDAYEIHNHELQRLLNKFKYIETEKEVIIEEINNTANSGIVDILNDQLSDSDS